MKNLFFVLAGAIVIMLSACGKDANVQQNQSDTVSLSKIPLIIGSWYYTTDTIRYYNNNTLDSTKSYFYFKSDNIVFVKDGTGVETRANVANNFTFTAEDNTIDLDFPTQPKLVSIKTDGIHNLVTSGYNVIATLVQVSSTNMELIFTVNKGTQTTAETAYFTK